MSDTGKPGAFADLKARTISALVLVAVAVLAGWLGGYAWAGLVAVAAGIMGWEAHSMVPPNKDRADAGLAVSVITGGASVILTQAQGMFVGLMAPLAGVLMLGVMDSRRYLRLALGIYVISMAAVGLVALRAVPDNGMKLVAWLVLVVVASDIGGYFGGRLIGGPKLWERVSPKKTWSGTVCGWVLAMLVAAVFAGFAGWPLAANVFWALPVAIAGQAGDLAESAVKRSVGIKDAGALIPGHGGLLDRFDALMGASLFATIIGIAGCIT